MKLTEHEILMEILGVMTKQIDRLVSSIQDVENERDHVYKLYKLLHAEVERLKKINMVFERRETSRMFKFEAIGELTKHIWDTVLLKEGYSQIDIDQAIICFLKEKKLNIMCQK